MIATVDADRLWRELDVLASFSDAAAPAVTRVVFSDTDLRARKYVKALCHDASLAVREDAVGNMFARWPGSAPDLPAVATGSHCDAIPNAGRFDGTVGVLGGIEAIRALQRSGFKPVRSIDVIFFTSEEPTRFGIGCLGSRLMAAALDAAAGETLVSDGRSLNEWRRQAGFDGPLAEVRLRPDRYAAFVELHIEQGPLLERDRFDIGVVTAIAAPATLRVTIEGEGGHAGAVLMPDRRDAFVAASEIALAVDAVARSTGSIDSVATTGVCELFPGAVNSVPSRARLEIDVRDIDRGRRDGMIAAIRLAAERVAAERRIKVTVEIVNADPPASCARPVIAAIEASCRQRNLRHRPIVSRAYHDSLFMARIVPIGMIFIPCRAGVSHRPDEYASPDAIARGTEVLADTLAALSSSSPH